MIVVDDEGRENEGDLIFAAENATGPLTAFMIRHTSGYICVGMEGDRLDALKLPPMTLVNEDRKGTAYAVTVDARDVAGTGISAIDRATTIRVLGGADTTADELTRPGHVMPLRAVRGGVLRRPGHTEAAVDLARLAGLQPSGALCEMVNDDGTMMDAAQCREFADEHGLLLASIADLIAYRMRNERHVERIASTMLPTVDATFQVLAYRSTLDGSDHAALVLGDIGDGSDVLVRVHVECLAGDVLGSSLCGCGRKLAASKAAVAQEGRGVILYLRPQEGQSLGVIDGLHGHAPEPGAPLADDLDYGLGAQILADLGVHTMRLLTAHPDRRYSLEGFGMRVTGTVPLT